MVTTRNTTALSSSIVVTAHLVYGWICASTWKLKVTVNTNATRLHSLGYAGIHAQGFNEVIAMCPEPRRTGGLEQKNAQVAGNFAD